MKMDEADPVDEDYLGNIERILKAGLDPGPTMTRRLVAEVRRLHRVRMAAERVDAKYREDDPWIDPTQLFEELCWLGTVLVETRANGT